MMIYSQPISTLAACQGRYPTESEETTVLDWADSLPKRLQASNLIAKHETDIVRDAIKEMKARHPRFEQLHGQAYEKSARDMQLVLRYATQGMVCEDYDMPKEKLYVWYSRIMRCFGMTPEYIRESLLSMYNACQHHLPQDSFTVAEPFLRSMIDDSANFPDPMKPAVD